MSRVVLSSRRPRNALIRSWDERLTLGAQPDFQHKTRDVTLFDAFGNTRERGRRYGIQFNYNFGG